MTQRRHITNDIAIVLTLSEEYINKLELLISGTPKYDNLAHLRKSLQEARWVCINKGYYDVETGWHKQREKRFKRRTTLNEKGGKLDDLHTKLTYILTDAFGEEQDGMRITEEEQLLINKQMNKLFGINVTSSPTEKTNGST
jgi:hypothetical protein